MGAGNSTDKPPGNSYFSNLFSSATAQPPAPTTQPAQTSFGGKKKNKKSARKSSKSTVKSNSKSKKSRK